MCKWRIPLRTCPCRPVLYDVYCWANETRDLKPREINVQCARGHLMDPAWSALWFCFNPVFYLRWINTGHHRLHVRSNGTWVCILSFLLTVSAGLFAVSVYGRSDVIRVAALAINLPMLSLVHLATQYAITWANVIALPLTVTLASLAYRFSDIPDQYAFVKPTGIAIYAVLYVLLTYAFLYRDICDWLDVDDTIVQPLPEGQSVLPGAIEEDEREPAGSIENQREEEMIEGRFSM